MRLIERAADPITGALGCLGLLVSVVVGALAYLVILIPVWFALTAIFGGDLWLEGSGGMPGTGDPIPVLGIISSFIAAGVLGWGWRHVKRALERLGLRRRRGNRDDRRIPGDVLQAVLERAQQDGRAMRLNDSGGKGERAALTESADALLALVAQRRTWLVQARRRVRSPIGDYEYAVAREHLDLVLGEIDSRSSPND